MKKIASILLAICASSVSSISIAAAQTEAAPYDGWITRSHYLPSYDGTRLAITIHHPSRDGKPATEKLPVIVTQDRGSPAREGIHPMRRYTDQGYIWISHDRRGTGASFGVQTGFVNQADAKDAKAVIEWSADQAFSNGRVVGMGCSNQAAWQYLVATMQPKGLVAIAPACASPQLFDDGIAINGVPMAKIGEQPYAGECNRPPSGARPAGFVPPPPQKVDEDQDGELLKAAIVEQRCGAAMLGQYWLNMPRDGYNDFAQYRPGLDDTAMTKWQAIRDSNIAILQIGGWFDAAVPGQFEGQSVWGGRVIMGPWVHGNRQGRGANFPNGDIDLAGETLRWFDHYAKGVQNGADKPGVRYYTLNAPPNLEWREAATWPMLTKKSFYFGDGNRLSVTPAKLKGSKVKYAPQDVKWFGGRYAPLARWTVDDMGQSDAKSLVHDGPQLTRDTEVTGAVTARLWVSADAPDVNVYAMLEDVDPSGKSTYVTDGRIRASWRKVDPLPWGALGRTWHRGYESDIKPIEPGQPVELEFDFFPISYVFKEGHRLRVALTTSIGEDYAAPPLANGKPVTLTLYRDADRPSALLVPIAER